MTSQGQAKESEILALIANPFSSEFETTTLSTALVSSLVPAAAFVLIFCFLRPRRPEVYAPKSHYATQVNGNGVFDWVRPTIRCPDEVLVQIAGVDAAVFVKFTGMMRNAFSVLAILGCGALLPPALIDSKTKSGVTFLKNATPNSKAASKPWIYVLVAYVFDGIICAFLWYNSISVAILRQRYLEHVQDRLNRTVVVTALPMEKCDKDSIRAMLDHRDPSACEDILLVDQTMCSGKSPPQDVEKYIQNAAVPSATRAGEVRDPGTYALATYATASAAYRVAASAPNSTGEEVVRLHADSTCVMWENLAKSPQQRKNQRRFSDTCIAMIIVAGIVPNVLISAFLSNLTHIGLLWASFGSSLRAHPVLWALVQAVAAPAITSLLYLMVPQILRGLCDRAGHLLKTDRDRHVTRKLFAFFLFNNLLIFSFFSAIFGIVAVAATGNLNPRLVIPTLFAALCQVSTYWFAWLLQRSVVSAIDISQIFALFKMPARRVFDFSECYTYLLFCTTIALSFGSIQPLVLPAIALYLMLDGLLKRYLLLFVYEVKRDSGGASWGMLCDRVLSAMALGNLMTALFILGQFYGSLHSAFTALALVPLFPVLFVFRSIIIARHETVLLTKTTEG